ncbi:hypothetical protein [Chitinophaga agri]|uniref:Uncharacterized protein n=1 Tax=Chitinophaga agri TaxID=2703787 RepID=A0A6B9ZFL2_9BACT|nr:hypothetical protein [Chitinophaga agri]QHS60846.1 hypothetical protein GWR21_14945 [Chitinophaga agri]
MDLGRLEKYKSQFKDFTPKIASLQTYFNDLSKSENDLPSTSADKVARKLRIPEFDALFLLSLAEREHIVQKRYKVWTNDNVFLGDYDNPSNIPDKIINDETGRLVDRDHFYVDIVFELET